MWHEQISSISTAAGKKLGCLFRARKYFSPSKLLTLYKAQIRPSLEYCSRILGVAAPNTLSILDAVQRRATRLIGDPTLACHLQPLSHRRAGGTYLLQPKDSRAMKCDERLLEVTFEGLIEFFCRVAAIRISLEEKVAARSLRERSTGWISILEEYPQSGRIYWNYSFSTLELLQANKPDIVLLDHQQKTMFVVEFSAPAEVNIVSKEEEKPTKYQELLGQLRRLWPDYAVSLLVIVIGSLGGMSNTLLYALSAMPVCRAAAHTLATRMQRAVIFGSLRLLRAHDCSPHGMRSSH
nr:unnamed protein product [Callosobruchus chinensis]